MRKLNTLPSARHRLLPKCDRWKRHNYRLIAKPVLEWSDLPKPEDKPLTRSPNFQYYTILQKPKPEYQNVFDGTSKLGDIVDCDGVLLRREKASSDGICTGCYIHSKRVVECKYKTNCGESDIFKLYIPE